MSSKIKSYEDSILDSFRPLVINTSTKQSDIIKHRKDFSVLCSKLSNHINEPPKKMSTFDFYTLLEELQKN